MKLHTDRLEIRITATLPGVFFLLFGLFSFIGARTQTDPYIVDRVTWFGVTMILTEMLAIGKSWLVRDLHNIWCVYPRTGRGTFRQ